MSYYYDSSSCLLTLDISGLSASNFPIVTISSYVYPSLSLSGYLNYTISSYIYNQVSLSGYFSKFTNYDITYDISSFYTISGYSSKFSLTSSGLVFNTISSYFVLNTTPWLTNTSWNRQGSTYLLGSLDTSGGDITIRQGSLYVSNTINGVPVSYLSNLYNTGTADQYARTLSGVVYSNYLSDGAYINSLQAYDKSLSGNIYANYFSQGASINSINNAISTLQSSSAVDQYSRFYEVSLSGIVNSNYFIQGASINSINNAISTLQGSSGVDQYARFYELSLSGIVNSNYFIQGASINTANSNISALQTKTTGQSYSGTTTTFTGNLTTTGGITGDSITSSTTVSATGRLSGSGLTTTGTVICGSLTATSLNSTNGNLTLTNGNITCGGTLQVTSTCSLFSDVSVTGAVNCSSVVSSGSISSGNISSTGTLSVDSTTTLKSIVNIPNNNLCMSDKAIYLRGTSNSDGNHYIQYNSTRDGPAVGGFAGVAFHTGGTERAYITSSTFKSLVDLECPSVNSSGSIAGTKLTLTESTGTSGNENEGTILLKHDNTGGQSSIVFRSKNNAGSDYGYIRYRDDDANGTGEASRLEIGLENDTSEDWLILQKSGGATRIGGLLYLMTTTRHNVAITYNQTYSSDFTARYTVNNWMDIGYDCQIYNIKETANNLLCTFDCVGMKDGTTINVANLAGSSMRFKMASGQSYTLYDRDNVQYTAGGNTMTFTNTRRVKFVLMGNTLIEMFRYT